ncbi:FecCD family ABC transporter permease [Corynebacterium lizhenjunii]|uniref:FecCD family ABC transporter permease n=1 Tax=Corynebacterium lizhenjunii TaxID=2709394 RepID=UPI0013EA8805|nr:iron ABC transporter permease [Corynebacterium lizhenjunii]
MSTHTSTTSAAASTPAAAHPALATQLRQQRRVRARAYRWRLGALLVAVVAIWWLSLMAGQAWFSPAEVWSVLVGNPAPGTEFTIGDLRLPRATIAVAAGLAFGLAGNTFQTMLRNQLASPDIIGISAAASAAGVTGLVLFHFSQVAVSAMSLVASLVVAAVIYVLSLKSGFSGTRLILIGIGLSAVLQAWTQFVISQAPQWDLHAATRWLTGSLNTMSWERGAPLLVCIVVLAPVMVALNNRLAVLQLGDALAIGLGLHLTVVRAALIGCAVVLVAVATATAGPVSFVAFMAGPIASRVFSNTTALLLPSALVGALLMLVADLAGQYLFGTRYPVGVITGALGAPFLIYLLIRSRR